MPLRRALMVSAGGAAVVMVQALFLGNQWVSEWVYRNDFLEGSSTTAMIRSILFFPRWRLTPAGGFKSMFVPDVGLGVFFVLLVAVTALGVMTLDPVRGMVGAFICGWWATFLAASAYAFVTQLLASMLFDFDAYLRLGVASGLEYGLLLGWIPGLAVMGAYALTRPNAAPAAPAAPEAAPA